ncbi:MAG: hypothetical protein WC180_05910 [Candidatus Paceibacterota bacterium]
MRRKASEKTTDKKDNCISLDIFNYLKNVMGQNEGNNETAKAKKKTPIMYYLLGAVSILMLTHLFISTPFDPSKPKDGILLIIIGFWLAIAILSYKEGKTRKQ